MRQKGKKGLGEPISGFILYSTKPILRLSTQDEKYNVPVNPVWLLRHWLGMRKSRTPPAKVTKKRKFNIHLIPNHVFPLKLPKLFFHFCSSLSAASFHIRHTHERGGTTPAAWHPLAIRWQRGSSPTRKHQINKNWLKFEKASHAHRRPMSIRGSLVDWRCR